MVLDFGILSSSLFPSSDAAGDGLSAPIVNQIIWKDVGIGIVPIGAIVAWSKSLAGTPPLLPSFQECDGAAITDGDSPMNGQNTPNLNGTASFARGNTTSGGTGGRTNFPMVRDQKSNLTTNHGIWNPIDGKDAGSVASTTVSIIPTYYDVVWVIRIK